MTNIFQTGTFYHPQELWNKLDAHIIAAGWTLRATRIANTDKVYTSSGEDGYGFNYLRMAHKQQDDIRNNVAFPNELIDGYADYVNFFGYQWHPSSGTDGYGEIGIFGPRYYSLRGGTTTDIEWCNFMTSTPSSPRWTDMKSNLTRAPISSRQQSNINGASVFDGRKFIYHNYGPEIWRYNISTGTDSYITNLNSRGAPFAIVYSRDLDRMYLYTGNQNTVSGLNAYLLEFDRDDNYLSSKTLNNPPWQGSSVDGGAAVGFGRYIYVWRGEDTNQGAVYDVDTDTWTSLPAFPAVGFRGGGDVLLITKEQSGFSNHRIYAMSGNGTGAFYYLDLNDDGSPTGGSWIARATIPLPAQIDSGAQLVWDGKDRIFYHPGNAGSTDREFYQYQLSTNTWSVININFAYASLSAGGGSEFHYSLQSRVRAVAGQKQKYWFFGNKDRIAVVTKDTNGFYHYVYAGSIDSYFDDSVRISTTSSITPGAAKIINIASTTNFAVGQKVQICDVSASVPFSVTGLDGRTKNFLKAEHFTITAINPGVSITADNINGSYLAGAKIGFDIQNFVISCEGTRYLQALNIPNTTNQLATGDVPECVYCVEPGVQPYISAQADLNGRTNQFVIWPMVVFTEGSVNRFSGKEVRGQLRGVFSAGTGTGVSEDLVDIGSETYMLFKIARQEDQRFFALGPVV